MIITPSESHRLSVAPARNGGWVNGNRKGAKGRAGGKEESPAYKLMFSTKCGNGSERFRAGPKRVAVRFEPPSQGPTDNMSFTGIKAGVLLFIMKDDDVIGPGRGSTRTEQVPQPKAEDLCNAQ